MNKFLPTILGATLLVASSYAQEPPAGQRPQPTQPQDRTQQAPKPGRVAGAESADSILVTTLLVANENEIALARLAQQRATSPEVKQFAQKMIDDHGKLVQKLQQAGGDAARTGQPNQGDPARDPSRPQEATKAPSSTTQPADASGVRVGAASGGIDHEKLIRDLGKKCLESATAMLNEKQGAEFDRCYMGMQLGAHMKAADTLEVFRTYASPALRPTLDEGLKVVQAHLQHAKELAKRTDELASAGNAARK